MVGSSIHENMWVRAPRAAAANCGALSTAGWLGSFGEPNLAGLLEASRKCA
jgi:hypothetical protein